MGLIEPLFKSDEGALGLIGATLGFDTPFFVVSICFPFKSSIFCSFNQINMFSTKNQLHHRPDPHDL